MFQISYLLSFAAPFLATSLLMYSRHKSVESRYKSVIKDAQKQSANRLQEAQEFQSQIESDILQLQENYESSKHALQQRIQLRTDSLDRRQLKQIKFKPKQSNIKRLEVSLERLTNRIRSNSHNSPKLVD